jgi:formate--tetrahydrofolate ligase
VSLGAEAALSEGYARGGDGMVELADKVVAAAAASTTESVRPLYDRAAPLEAKIHEVATKVYGADGVSFKPAARTRLQQFEKHGYGHLPICIAKTQYSFSDDAKVMGAPTGWTLTISDASISAGAGFVVAIAGSMMLMPGLGKTPQAHKLDVDEHGAVVGMDY